MLCRCRWPHKRHLAPTCLRNCLLGSISGEYSENIRTVLVERTSKSFRGMMCRAFVGLFCKNKKVAACVIVLVRLIGGTVSVISSRWAGSMIERECPCTSERCCKFSDSCPNALPCSCLSEENDWMSVPCEETSTSFGELYPLAVALSILGCLLALPLFFLVYVLLTLTAVFVSVLLCVYLGFAFSGVLTSFKTLFSKLCTGSNAPLVELSTVKTST